MTKSKDKIECRTHSHGCDNFCRVIGFILFVRPSSVLVTKWTRTSTVILHRLSASFCVSSLPFTFMRCRNVVFSNLHKFYGTNQKKKGILRCIGYRFSTRCLHITKDEYKGAVTLCNISCNLSRNAISRQVARNTAQCKQRLKTLRNMLQSATVAESRTKDCTV